MKLIYMYKLIDPRTNDVRYIGKTINPKRRYKQHLYDKRKSYKASWVQSLRNKGLKPIMEIVECCNEDNWKELEVKWITKYDNLTNLKKGGGSDYIRTTTDETRKKLSEKFKGRKLSSEWKKKIGLNSPNREQLIINGIGYSSIKEAMRECKIGFKKAQKYVTK